MKNPSIPTLESPLPITSLESRSTSLAPRRLSRHLMVSGLGFWGLSVSGAQAPRLMHSLFYPNHGDAPQYILAPAHALGAPVLWTALIMWCVSWAFVVGYFAEAWAARQGRPSWAAPVVLVLSLVSPLVFGVAASALVSLATRDAYHCGVIPFLPAVATQLAISLTHFLVTGLRSLGLLQHAEGL